jgi:hypothetical protein
LSGTRDPRLWMSFWTRMMQTLTVLGWPVVFSARTNHEKAGSSGTATARLLTYNRASTVCVKKILKRDEYVSTTNKHSMTTAMLSMTPFFRSAITRLRKPYSMIFHER